MASIFGDGGNNVINPGNNSNYVNALGGNDTINSGIGNDTLVGGTGSDLINDNGGMNIIYGDLGPGEGMNLLENGSFEFPAAPPMNGFTSDGSIPGWTSLNMLPFERVAAGFGRGAPAEGFAWLDLEASPGNLDIQSTVGTTVGETYQLSFALNNSSGNPDNGVRVYLGDQLIQTITGAQVGGPGFQTFDIVVTSTMAGGKLRFEHIDATPDNEGFGLDNVSLVSLDQTGGADGNDTINSGNGNDTVYGGGGNDLINANEGMNLVYAGNGNDTVTAGNSNDRVFGGAGNDLIHANEGNNDIDAGAGNDTVTAGNGNDVIIAGTGDDVVYANGGQNKFQLGGISGALSDGNDQYYGGNQADKYALFLDTRTDEDAGWGNDTINGFRISEGDQLVAFNSQAGFWDDNAALNGLVMSDFITASRGTGNNAGDLTLTFATGLPNQSSVTLKWFFWDNGAFGTTIGSSTVSDAQLVNILKAAVQDGGTVGVSGADFLQKGHNYISNDFIA